MANRSRWTTQDTAERARRVPGVLTCDRCSERLGDADVAAIRDEAQHEDGAKVLCDDCVSHALAEWEANS